MNIEPLNCIDFYKADHRNQYPKGTTKVFSNWTPRYSRLDGVTKVVVFGLQYYIKEYLVKQWNEQFFSQPLDQVLERYKRRMKNSLIDIKDFDHIVALHKLGYLPIEIRSLLEGSSCPIRCPMFTITNTHPDFFWLTNYLETQLSSAIWQACTSATLAKEYKKIFTKFMEKTGGPLEFVDFMGHDFSYRGMSSQESAAISGAAHLLSFKGTDTVPAIDFLEQYYGANSDEELIGCSVPATEHSVMCVGTADKTEFDTFERLITEVYPHGIVSIVSDTYNYYRVWTEFLPLLKDKILARSNNSPYPINKVVIRPDSGDPVKIICGEDYDIYDTLDGAKCCVEDMLRDKASEDCEGSYCCGDESYSKIVKIKDGNFYKITVKMEYNRHDKTYYYVEDTNVLDPEEYNPTPEFKGSFQLAWEIFGGEINEKGFKVLHPAIGLIYGDSITLERAKSICTNLVKKGFVPAMVFGIGSYTYQYNTRDTFGFAIKSTYSEINSNSVEIFKDPVTDNGTKKSAKGLTSVYRDENGEFYLKDQCTEDEYNSSKNNLIPVFKDGKLLLDQKLSYIRAII